MKPFPFTVVGTIPDSYQTYVEHLTAAAPPADLLAVYNLVHAKMREAARAHATPNSGNPDEDYPVLGEDEQSGVLDIVAVFPGHITTIL